MWLFIKNMLLRLYVNTSLCSWVACMVLIMMSIAVSSPLCPNCLETDLNMWISCLESHGTRYQNKIVRSPTRNRKH